MEKHQIELIAKQTSELIFDGYHCSEAMIKSIEAMYGDKYDPILFKISSGFAGGIGKSRIELCGALSGGIIVIGYFFGRSNFLEDDSKCFGLSKKYLEFFTENFDYTSCDKLRSGLSHTDQKKKCRDIICQSIVALYNLIENPYIES